MSTQLTEDDLRAKRDLAVQAANALERRINENAKRMAILEQEKAQCVQVQQQLLAEMLSTQAYVSGMNVALGEEPIPSAVSTSLLATQGLAGAGKQA